MKKNLFFILVAMLVGTGIAFSQTVPGTALEGTSSSRGILANGLTDIFSITGNYTLSADGAGNASAPYTVDVNKPNAGALVHVAYLMNTSIWGTSIGDNFITFAGTPIVWDASVINSINSGTNYYKDVTSIVAPIVNAAPMGITSISVTENAYGTNDGVALLVVFSDPLAFTKTCIF